MALNEYLVTEVALDHVEGHLSRRDALRRLGLLGLSVAGASALITACGGSDSDDADPQPTTAQPTTAAPTTSAAPTVDAGYDVAVARARTQPIRFGTLMGSFAAASSPKGAVLVVHENKGLTDHIRAVTGRLAGDGYSALAVDLLSREGGTAATEDATAGLGRIDGADLVADLQAGLVELARRAPGSKLGTMGFCFGGGMVWQLLDAGAPQLAAAVPFYGPAPDAPDFTKDKAAVLGVFAEQDSRVNAGKTKLEAALTKAGLTHELRTVPGVDHAFFNDTGPRFDLAAATSTYAVVLDWFGTHLT